MENKIISIFPTALMLVDMSNHPCKETALEIIQNTKIKNHKLLDNGNSSFDTNQILDHPRLSKLKEDIMYNINQYTTTTGYLPLKIANNWFNIMDTNGVVTPHRHEASVLSGAYYINAPEGSSNLHFTSPLKPYRMNDLFTRDTSFNEYYHSIPCVEDLLIIFPSWLEHYTDKNNNNTRTVISFNTERYS